MDTSRLTSAAAAIGSLTDDLRRNMYLFIRRRGRPVSRDEAAQEVGISRKLAAWHLDKLVDRGLLEVHFARPPGRSGPGAGRSAKFYRPAAAEVAVSLPPRAYDWAADILLEAIDRAGPGESPREAAASVAHDRGVELGEQVRRAGRIRAPGPERALALAEEILDDRGFEPYRDEAGGVRLRNCPFQALARKSPDVVCGLNQAFVRGLLHGLGNDSVDAALEPPRNECCVHLQKPRPNDAS